MLLPIHPVKWPFRNIKTLREHYWRFTPNPCAYRSLSRFERHVSCRIMLCTLSGGGWGVSLLVWRMLRVDYGWGLGRSGWGSIYCLCSDGSRVRDGGGRDLSSIAGIYWELT